MGTSAWVTGVGERVNNMLGIGRGVSSADPLRYRALYSVYGFAREAEEAPDG
jgi:hypothetical protein